MLTVTLAYYRVAEIYKVMLALIGLFVTKGLRDCSIDYVCLKVKLKYILFFLPNTS